MSESEVVSADDSDAVDESDRLRGEVAVLREENERLREEYARAKQSQYRQSAATLAAIGVLSFGAGVVIGDARTVLFALGGTGVFLGVLLYFLTPERFISASVGEAVYASLARNEAQVVDELGLAEQRVYVPRDGAGSAESVRLFVPQRSDYEVPDGDALETLFVVADDGRRRGVAFRPTAAELYADFQQAVTEPSTDPAGVAAELRDALVEQFELAESVAVDVDPDARQAAFRVGGSAMGRVDRFDHPIVSLLGVGLGRAVGQPVTAEVTLSEEGEDRYVVTCTWQRGDGPSVDTD